VNLGLLAGQQRQCLGEHAGLAAHQAKGGLLARTAGEQVNLGAQSISGMHQSLFAHLLRPVVAYWCARMMVEPSMRMGSCGLRPGQKWLGLTRPSAETACAYSCTCRSARAGPPSANRDGLTKEPAHKAPFVLRRKLHRPKRPRQQFLPALATAPYSIHIANFQSHRCTKLCAMERRDMSIQPRYLPYSLPLGS
jgi:hypothetical protein